MPIRGRPENLLPELAPLRRRILADQGVRLFQRRQPANIGKGKFVGRTLAIAVRFEPGQRDALADLALEHETSIAAIVRAAVDQYLEQRKGKA